MGLKGLWRKLIGDNYNGTPNSYICPRVGNVWSELENVMKDFEVCTFWRAEFFFVENGELIDLLETHIAYWD
ncbi:MAG: hypothetical protein IPI30_10720 [Saprospiraceae bacterium]|nr:hypothetical protein [Candidatus Vicinibacter affinis]